jgi:hypothetical protein
MAAAAPTCYGCKRGLDRETWLGGGACQHCGSALEFLAFPAQHAARGQARAQIALSEDAACFFHADNRADAVCEGCGRYLCAVCQVDFVGARLCPQCISTQSTAKKNSERGMLLHDSVALTSALVPLIIWPVTLVTAPVAFGYAIYAWRKPLSVTRRSRWRIVVAGILTLLCMLGWTAVGVIILASPKE